MTSLGAESGWVLKFFWYGGVERRTGQMFADEVQQVYRSMRKSGNLPSQGLLRLVNNACTHRCRVVQDLVNKLPRLTVLSHPAYSPRASSSNW